jgi:DNA-binding beta-propeller fold protein YncE
LIACVPVATVAVGAHGAGSGLPLRVVARVPLSGPPVRFDYTSFDPRTNWLWIAHMDANQLLVYDVVQRRVLKTIPMPGVHGVLVVPSLNRVYASATDAHQVVTMNARTAAILARAAAGAYPDGLAYDPRRGVVFVSDESGGAETVLDASGHRSATIPLGGAVGNVQYDSGSDRVLADVQTLNEIAIIDPQNDRVVRRVPIPGCFYDHGLLVDAPRRLAFVACLGNARLFALDLRTMKVIGGYGIGQAPDVLALDVGLHRLYVSSESGIVSVFAETRAGLRSLGSGFVAPRAHTVAVDPSTHRVYFPLQAGTDGQPQLLIMEPK